MIYLHLLVFFLLAMAGGCYAQNADKLIKNGMPWLDNNGDVVNAHGACIVKDGGKYYLFGEWKSDKTNDFPGFSCYSSTDLVNWTFERVVLPMQKEGIMGPNRVGERVKVMRCPQTGEYVMYMHSDDPDYRDPYTAYATCSTINGEYEMQGPLLMNGKPLRHWDMGTFQDTDGTGYILIHHGPIYRLSADYKSVEKKVAHVKGMGESPAMFKKNGTYYLLTSDLTSWEKNDNFYFTAPSISGPWKSQGYFCPPGTQTWNSQATFVLPLVMDGDTIPMYMGDRWSYPRQASAATYVWLPMQVDGERLSIPQYWEAWNPTSVRPADLLCRSSTVAASQWHTEGAWQEMAGRRASNQKGARIEVPFEGSRAAIVGQANAHGGYARVTVTDSSGTVVSSQLVDFYSKSPADGVRLITPSMPRAHYVISIEVTGDHPEWTDKTKTIYGSDDFYVVVDQVRVF